MKKWIFGVLAVVVLIGTVTVLVFHFNSMERRFPIWEEHRGTTKQEEAVLIYLGVESFNKDKDELLISIENQSEESLTYTPGHWVEYYDRDEWHRVYGPGATPSVVCTLPGGYEAEKESYLVPAGLLSVPGKYRLYLEGLGYCEFDVE